ncbi:Lysine exporter protein (LYSE/YGGA) [Actinobacteria bacterium OK074]|nr:Lysine exporter protein (LYSE/YGGA) [Actinobacteria bacterium OK074]
MTGIAGYTAVAGLVVLVPGADTLVVVRNTLRGGSGSAVRTTAGVCAGLVAWALLSSAGLAAAVAASPTLFAVLKAAGAAYLVYLGVQALISSSRPAATEPVLPAGRDWRQGALTSLGNPKVGVFYTSLLPQFLPSHGSPLAASVLLAAIHIALSFLSLIAYGVLASRMGDIFRKEKWSRVLETTAGVALCAIGLWLLVSAVAEN